MDGSHISTSHVDVLKYQLAIILNYKVPGYFHKKRFILRVGKCTSQCRLGNCTKQILDSALSGALFRAEKSLLICGAIILEGEWQAISHQAI